MFQVAIVWGIGIATAIYLTGSLSSAHLNAAVDASAAWSRFPGSLVLPYIGVQLLGAFAAAALLYALFGGSIRAYETKHHIVRGATGSEATAMVFGEYFPNPGGKPLTEDARETMTPGAAFAAEVVGTAILLLVIFCSTDERNANRPQLLTAVTVGLTITILISLLGPLTMACFNPARDLGPRLFFRHCRMENCAFHHQRFRLANGLHCGADCRRIIGRRHLSGLLPGCLSRVDSRVYGR